MKVLVSPDKFRGTLTAPAAAAAMAAGVQRAAPRALVLQVPLCDGGEGTVEILQRALGGELIATRVPGPLDEQVVAHVLRLDARRAVVEMAAASGIRYLRPSPFTALRAHSCGTGSLIAFAAEVADEVLVGIGGTASTDAGAGAAAATGWAFLDAHGNLLPPGGAALCDLDEIRPPARGLGATVTGLWDVDNPLLGPDGAARVFARQKGASPAEVEILDRALCAVADEVRRSLGLEVSDLPGTGAGGGMGAGTIAFFGGELRSGSRFVATAVGLDEALRDADLVITGEGALDASSDRGKVTGMVRQRCVAADVDHFVVVGEDRAAGDDRRVYSLVDVVGPEHATGDAAAAVERATEEAVRVWMRRR